MSATVTPTPGTSYGPVLGSFDFRNPLVLTAGAVVPKGLWLATGTGAGGGTPAFQVMVPGASAAVPCALIASDGQTVTAVGAFTLYDYIAG